MAEAKKCDRCGKYYDDNTCGTTGEKVIGFEILKRNDCNVIRSFQKFDLCDDCVAGLFLFIEGENND